MERLPKLTYACTCIKRMCTTASRERNESWIPPQKTGKQQKTKRNQNPMQMCIQNLMKSYEKQMPSNWKSDKNEKKINWKSVEKQLDSQCMSYVKKTIENPPQIRLKTIGNSVKNKLLIHPNVEGELYPSMKEMSKNRARVRGLPARLASHGLKII